MVREYRGARAVVLLSGGIDSTVTLYLSKKRKYQPCALIFNYSQKHKKETLYAVKNAKKLGIPYHIITIALPWGGSALTDRGIAVPLNQRRRGVPSTYVPARNIIFLSFAFSFAETIKAKKIFIGAHTQDYSGYPDCRPEFLRSFENSVHLGMKNKSIAISAPLIDKRKSEIISLGLSLGVDFSETWSCYNGWTIPCGGCDSCRFRLSGFKDLGLQDPATTAKKR